MSEAFRQLTQHDLRLLTGSWMVSLFIWSLIFRRYNHLHNRLQDDRARSDERIAQGQFAIVVITSLAASSPISSGYTVLWFFVWACISYLLSKRLMYVYTLWHKNISIFWASALASTILIGASAIARLTIYWIVNHQFSALPD